MFLMKKFNFYFMFLNLQMMVPFANNGQLTERQLNFNRRLSQCRVRVENSFAHAKGRWHRLKFLPSRRRDIVVDHITASFVLHNFLICQGEPMMDVSCYLQFHCCHKHVSIRI